jgi:tetratricopeptide (TPR) repeat protein
LEASLERDAADVDIRISLANGYLSVGRLEDARRLMQEVPASVADDPRIVLAQGQLALAAGEPFAAVSLFEHLVQRMPTSAEALYLLASASAVANNTNDAASALVTAFKLDPMHERAAPSFKAVLASMPTFATKQQLVADLEAANPGQPRGAYFEALMLQETAKPNQALAILEDLHEKHPDDRLYYDALVTQQARSGDKTSAIETASTWLAEHPEDVQASRQLAQLHAEQGDRQRALKAYQAVISENPNDAVALNNLAELLRESRPAEALDYAKRAHAAAPANPAIRDTLGMALLATGDLAGALENLGAAYKDASGNPQVGLHYAQALIAADKRDQARTLLQELASKSFDGADEAKTLLDQLK